MKFQHGEHELSHSGAAVGLALFLLFLSVSSIGAQPAPPLANNPSAPGEYVLQRGDDLEIRAYNMPELNADARIRPDGKISVLLLNDVQASGLTPVQLMQAITEGYVKQNFRNPRLTVIVKSFAAQNVYVGGEVGLPASLPLRGQLTAVQAVLQAGGVKEATASDQVTIVHDVDKGGPQSETVSIKEVLSGQKADMVLRPSDVVYVQKSAISVYIGGEVLHPGLVPLNGDLTVLAAVFQAGGFRPTAKTDSVVLLRDSGKGTPTASKIKLDDVFLSSPQTKLKPFDVVFVPKSRIAKLNQWVDQYIRQMSPATLSVGFSYLFGASFSGSSSTPF